MAKKIKEYEEYIVKVTQNAENDINEIIDYISQNNPQTALIKYGKNIYKNKFIRSFS